MKRVKKVKKVLIELGWVIIHLSIPFGLGFIVTNTGIGKESPLLYGTLFAVISLYIKIEANESKIEDIESKVSESDKKKIF